MTCNNDFLARGDPRLFCFYDCVDRPTEDAFFWSFTPAYTLLSRLQLSTEYSILRLETRVSSARCGASGVTCGAFCAMYRTVPLKPLFFCLVEALSIYALLPCFQNNPCPAPVQYRPSASGIGFRQKNHPPAFPLPKTPRIV